MLYLFIQKKQCRKFYANITRFPSGRNISPHANVTPRREQLNVPW